MGRLALVDEFLKGDVSVSFVLPKKFFVPSTSLSHVEGPVGWLGLVVLLRAHFGTRLIFGGFRFTFGRLTFGNFGICQPLFGWSDTL